MKGLPGLAARRPARSSHTVIPRIRIAATAVTPQPTRATGSSTVHRHWPSSRPSCPPKVDPLLPPPPPLPLARGLGARLPALLQNGENVVERAGQEERCVRARTRAKRRVRTIRSVSKVKWFAGIVWGIDQR